MLTRKIETVILREYVPHPPIAASRVLRSETKQLELVEMGVMVDSNIFIPMEMVAFIVFAPLLQEPKKNETPLSNEAPKKPRPTGKTK